MQLLGLAIMVARFAGKLRFGSGKHSKKEFCFLRFLYATRKSCGENPFSKSPRWLRSSFHQYSFHTQPIDQLNDHLSDCAESFGRTARSLRRIARCALLS